MAEAVAMKTNTEEERVLLRAVIARGTDLGCWNECPCGWFYSGPRCPDKGCKEWTTLNGIKRTKLYAHVDKESNYDTGKKLGMDEAALRTFSYWGDEIEFEADVNIETGEVTLIMIDGHKIFPVKG